MLCDLFDKKSEWWEEIAVWHFAASHKDSCQVWAEDEVINGFLYYHNSVLIQYNVDIVEEEEFRNKYFLDGIDAYYDCYYRKYRIFIPNVKLEDFFDPYWQRHMVWEDNKNKTTVKTLQPAKPVKSVGTVLSQNYEKKKVIIEPKWLKK